MDTCTRNLEKFVDLDACLALIDELTTKLGDDLNDQKVRSSTERLVETFRKIIDKYQEQPELLEPHAPNLIERLTEHLVDIKNSANRFHTTFKLLYQLIKVIGFKSVGRRFPHETNKLALLVDLLAREDPNDKSNWQTRFVLIVWLSIVILAPFDLSKFDSGSSDQTMQDKIYQTLMKSLINHDSSQHVAAFCLARFFSRPDTLKDPKLLDEFISNTMKDLDELMVNNSASGLDIKLIGCLRTLTYLYKFLPRDEQKKRCEPIFKVLTGMEIEKINRELISHLIIKLVQRVGMSLLSKRIATWRYKRGSRILGHKEQQQQESQATKSLNGPNEVSHLDQDTEIEEAHSVDALQSVLNILFVAAQSAQTKIRWSAAKGIARLSSRLSRERASDVIDTVMTNFFDPNESSEYAWHGGCLTLAEMSRQGLIMEEKLPGVVEIVDRSIIYDKIKGSFAVGSHVREAACYILWAMARTYEDRLLEPYISTISVNLLCTMLFDRELQCRRAASATFQELVGRQGTFNIEGISILTNVDYQSVGVRQFAYIGLATQVARFGKKYYEPFIKHLIEKKLGHWDVQIRRLASDSMGALMLYPDHDFIGANVIPPIIRMCEQNVDNNAKHGAILALAKVIKSLVALGYQFEQTLIDSVGSMALSCSKQLASKQLAPNYIEAIGNLISSSEIAQFNYSEETLAQWESIILQALDSDNGEILNIGAEGILSLYRYFYKSNKTCKDRLLTILNESLQSANESSRCGALRSLAKLGLALSDTVNIRPNEQQTGGEIRLDSDTPDIILMSLTSYVGAPTKDSNGNVFAHAKATACEALVDFVKTLDKSRLIISSQWLRVGFDALLDRSEDYTFDKRGDIGVVVRRSAIKSLQDLTLFLLSIGMTSILVERLAWILSKILQQAVSYNNSARELAALAFYRLIVSSSTVEPALPETCIPHKEEILQLFELYQVDAAGETFNWRDESTPIFVCLLARPEYSKDLWIGLMSAMGQASDLCAKQFRDAFTKYVQSLEKMPSLREQILESFLQTLEKPDLASRLVTSGLIVADYLLTSGLLHDTDEQFQVRFAHLCWQMRGQGDPKRLVSVGQVLCSMLQFSGRVQIDCLRYCLALLVSGYSKVRVFIATALYSGLLTYQSELEENLRSASTSIGGGGPDAIGNQEVGEVASGAPKTSPAAPAAHIAAARTQKVANEARDEKPKEMDLELAMELLAQSNWSEPLDKVRPIRDQICSSLLIEL